MKRLQKLIESLSRSELKRLRSFLLLFSNRPESKIIELLDCLLSYPDCDEAEACILLYGEDSQKAFQMLQSRLITRILDFLSINASVHRGSKLRNDDYTYRLLGLQKQLHYATLIYSRGIYDMARELFWKSYRDAEVLGATPLKLQALSALQELAISPNDKVWKRCEEVAHLISQIQQDMNAQCVGYTHQEFLGTYTKPLLYDKKLTQQIERFEAQLATAYSPIVHFHLLHLQSIQYEREGEYESALQCLENIEQLLKMRNRLFPRYYNGVRLMQEARIALILGQFEEAERLATVAEDELEGHKGYALKCQVLHIYLHIYRQNWDKAEWLCHIVEHDFVRSEAALKGHLTYLLACITYGRGEPQEAKRLLSDARRHLARTNDRDPFIRIFEIMIALELCEFRLADYRMDSLRKLLHKYPCPMRSKAIYKYLRELERTGYDFLTTQLKHKALFDDVNHSREWNPLGYELFRFDLWLVKMTHNEQRAPIVNWHKHA